MRGSLLQRFLSATFGAVNRRLPWHRLPRWLAIVNLIALRNDLRRFNLHDTPSPELPVAGPPVRDRRTVDGTWNDLDDPAMGCAGSRFGRNVPLDRTRLDGDDALLAPNPRLVSDRLLARDAFKPATTLNVLAAAWIQFQNHEWFNHHRKTLDQQPLCVPLADGDGWHENPMRVERSEPMPGAGPCGGRAPTFHSSESHWWDGSQIYGSTAERRRALRSGEDGKLAIGDDGLLPEDPQRPGFDLTGFNDNYWLGLSLLHTLFSREHNAICDRLRQAHPGLDDDQLFAKAQLVNGALMAKIHTIEWTPGILGHPTLRTAMNINWWGLLGERFKKRFGRLGSSQLLSGIPGAPTDHFGVPYQLSEEFVAVYRLHPLIPDDYELRALAGGELLEERGFDDLQGAATRAVCRRHPTADLFYSLGVAHPGAITLHNFPDALRRFERPDGVVLDLATVDLLRDRERGVPRYNDFRELLRRGRVSSFDEITDDPRWARQLEEVYEGDVDRVDTMVGMYAEPPPRGFGFSDTAFRVFILMASRRLNSDRFFTAGYTPEIYTPEGLEWVESTTMTDVLLRHHPQLAPALEGVANPFAPWKRRR